MPNLNVPWVESPFFHRLLKTKNLPEAHERLASHFHEHGFAVLSGVFPDELIDRVRLDAETKAFNPDFPIRTQRNHERVQDFWRVSEACRELASHSGILEVLKMLYGRQPIPFQTLNFSVGTQQRAHSDTIHFSSQPARFMCGVWVALEDVTDENGPLFYYPGSHRLPEYNFSHIKQTAACASYDDYKEYEDFIEAIIEVNPYERKIFKARKGDALIWSSNILHGGAPVIKEGSTRWSQVTHYFFEDCYYYTPMLSNMVTGELFLRHGFTDIATGEKVGSSYNGEKLKPLNLGENHYVLGGAAGRSRLFAALLRQFFSRGD